MCSSKSISDYIPKSYLYPYAWIFSYFNFVHWNPKFECLKYCSIFGWKFKILDSKFNWITDSYIKCSKLFLWWFRSKTDPSYNNRTRKRLEYSFVVLSIWTRFTQTFKIYSVLSESTIEGHTQCYTTEKTWVFSKKELGFWSIFHDLILLIFLVSELKLERETLDLFVFEWESLLFIPLTNVFKRNHQRNDLNISLVSYIWTISDCNSNTFMKFSHKCSSFSILYFHSVEILFEAKIVC